MTDANASAYRLAKERYAALGVDTDAVLATLDAVPLSLHCWQGDDVAGFEAAGDLGTAGIAATGNHPGKARSPGELRADLEVAMAQIPGPHRVNLHASYAETGNRKVERAELLPDHFTNWLSWARERKLGLDFNPTFFAHPMAASGQTLSHPDLAVRRYWIAHGQACRRIGAYFGKALGTPAVTNVWIPDGQKDSPFDRFRPRERLKAALDEVFAEPLDPAHNLDAVEPKLFGIGSESYVVGSHEFYLAYAGYVLGLGRTPVMPCYDLGHFHPTESVADKLTATLLFHPRLLLHVSRGVRWDSDHVALFGDELLSLATEAVRGNFLGRIHFALDYFDASINRVAAWVIGARAWRKALLFALLEPGRRLREAEEAGDGASRLAWLETAKTLPWSAVWERYCEQKGVPADAEWLAAVLGYEVDVLARRK